MNGERNVIFVDGFCVMCNRIVWWLMQIDRRRRLSFATLQGTTAKQAFTENPDIERECAKTSTVIYVRCFDSDKPQIYMSSSAALKALWDIGGFWRLSAPLLLVPAVIRDVAYQWIARNRYRWFGQKEDACLLPSSEDQSRFLDS